MKRLLISMVCIVLFFAFGHLDNYAEVDGNGNIIFEDANLKQKLLDEEVDTSDDGFISIAEAEAIRSLDLYFSEIENISGIEYFVNLRTLDMEGNSTSDISELSGLAKLESLSLSYNSISDISAVSGLVNLNELFLTNNSISDISTLSGLTNLNWLYLDDNNISDISALSGLVKLEDLDLANNSISDISALSGLVNLEDLDMDNNSISDISVVSGLVNLTELSLSGNNISDISALSGLMNLIYLDVSSNPINDSNTRWAEHKEDLDFTVDENFYEVWVINHSKINDLTDLTISTGTLAPVFEVDTLDYKVTVDETVVTITVTPIKLEELSSITVNNQVVNSGEVSQEIILDYGPTTIEITVTADNGDLKTYVITVTRTRGADDINQDGFVDTKDTADVARHYGGDVRNGNEIYDINGDGVIDILDIILIMQKIGN